MTTGLSKFLRAYYGRVKEYLSSLPEKGQHHKREIKLKPAIFGGSICHTLDSIEIFINS